MLDLMRYYASRLRGLKLAVTFFVIVGMLSCTGFVRELTASEDLTLEAGFQSPPKSTKPWCFWYWMSNNISKEGITHDLEAMAKVGIGEALIGSIAQSDIPFGEVETLSETWWEAVEHAVREGQRLGVDVGLFNSPGWSQSGGPWVPVELSMRCLEATTVHLEGPGQVKQKLPTPTGVFQDVAVLAFPAPKDDSTTMATLGATLQTQPPMEGLERILDGQAQTSCALPAEVARGEAPMVFDFAFERPTDVRSLVMMPSQKAWAADCQLQYTNHNGEYQTVRQFTFDRSNMRIEVGPIVTGPVSITFPVVTARQFRLILTNVTGEQPSLAEVLLTPAARLESYMEKQLGKLHPTPLPLWDAYLWSRPTEPESAQLVISPDSILDITHKMQSDGTLQWRVPDGEWVVTRYYMRSTGTKNGPTSPEAIGPEIDKMSREAAKLHFDAYVGELLRRIPPDERRSMRRVVADSYEQGSQNWTEDFETVFQETYSYNPVPWLPVLSGRVIGSAEQSERFLWDMRRLVADLISKNYVGGLRDLCHEHDLQLWLENYGHWGFPGEFLQYGGYSDCISGEYWLHRPLGAVECRAATSSANTYGHPFVSAEAFTGGPQFRSTPLNLKARGDWSFCEGINHLVLHLYIHQPWDDRRPGVAARFGTEFNRHNTWFDASDNWIAYLRRCCFMLQQGTRVADVAYFIGEDTPKMTGVRDPPLPLGRDYDYINGEVLLNSAKAQDGKLALQHGASYRLLVLPKVETIRPELLEKISELVRNGVTILGPRPVRSPSLEDFPECDQQVQELATGLWGPRTDSDTPQVRTVGKGRVITGISIDDIFEKDNFPVDFMARPKLRHTHRVVNGQHIYFVANPYREPVKTTAAFRVHGLSPERFFPMTGKIAHAAVYQSGEQTVQMPLELGPHGSLFVVFRQQANHPAVVQVKRNDQLLIDARNMEDPAFDDFFTGPLSVADNFTCAVWVKPAKSIPIPSEAGSGVGTELLEHNPATEFTMGNYFGPIDGHAGVGLSVGNNGIGVLEHTRGHLPATVVKAVPVTDWTHVAVVYRDRRPDLYINGTFVRRGKKSAKIPHPGRFSDAFVGEKGSVWLAPRSLTDDEIAMLAKEMVSPVFSPEPAPIALAHSGKGELQATLWQTGRYDLLRSDKQQETIVVDDLPQPLVLDGPWEVEFRAMGQPSKTVTFQKLTDWTLHGENWIKFFSGTAVYRKKIQLPETAAAVRVALDLGEVCHLATVRVDGNPLPTLWLPPWKVDLTEQLTPGEHLIEVEVTNAWNNRLVGDAIDKPTKPTTFLVRGPIKPTTPLIPAGLLGPVLVEFGKSVSK